MALPALTSLNLRGIHYHQLTKKELKLTIKEFARQKILEGWITHEVILLTKNEFCVPIEGTEKLLANPQAVTKWVEELMSDIASASRDIRDNYDNNLSTAQDRLEHLYRLCMATGNVREANKILEHLHRVQGLDSGNRVVVNMGIVNNNQNGKAVPGEAVPAQFKNMTNEELKGHIEAQPTENIPLNTVQTLDAEIAAQQQAGKEVLITQEGAEILVEHHNKTFDG